MAIPYGDKWVETWRVRRDAARALGEIGDRRAVKPLITALKDRYEEVRRDAANALMKINDPRAVKPLRAALKDESWLVRSCACKAIGKIGDRRAVKPLIATLKDQDKYVREAAANALERIGWQPDKQKATINYSIAKREWARCAKIGLPAVKPLIAVLTDISSDVRRGACGALGKIGDQRAVKSLIATLKDQDKYVREAAASALEGIGWQPNRRKVRIYHWIAKGQWERCVEIGAPAVRPLIVALDYKDEGVRKAAAEALGKIGDKRAIGPLSAALESWNTTVQQAAAEALGRISEKEARENSRRSLWRAFSALIRDYSFFLNLDSNVPCEYCRGRGEHVSKSRIFTTYERCNICNGSGYAPCKFCDGRGFMYASHQSSVCLECEGSGKAINSKAKRRRNEARKHIYEPYLGHPWILRIIHIIGCIFLFAEVISIPLLLIILVAFFFSENIYDALIVSLKVFIGILVIIFLIFMSFMHGP